MKNILCYGDSNTFGYDPYTDGRYDYDVRWPGALQNILGRDQYYVVEEGLGDRTTVLNDPLMYDNKNGHALLPAIIASHMPLDLIIIMLGTNDTKARYGAEAPDIARSAVRLAQTAKFISSVEGEESQVLLIAPMPITEDVKHGGCSFELGDHSIRVAAEMPQWYKRFAGEAGIPLLDASEFVQASEEDGVHLTPEGHRILAEKVAAKIKEMIG